MEPLCIRRWICPNKPVCTTGHRTTVHYPDGGKYSGDWECNKRTFWGVKESPKKANGSTLIYEGLWKNNIRHGHGKMLRRKADGTIHLIYMGDWKNDKKSGEGKKIYEDGTVYFGFWQENRRHGLGMQWYTDGSLYVGEWQGDYRDGIGVMFYANGNRYEGHFARGYKNGEGVFYHNHTGQIQKGMWENDHAKVSIMQDEMRNQVDQPTPYPIPKNYLKDPNVLVRDLFQRFMPNADKPMRSFSEKVRMEYISKIRHFAKFEERFATNTTVNLYSDNKFA